MVRETLIEAFNNSWPMFVIVLVILSTLRLADTFINKKPLVIYREFITLGFITYILCLFYVVTFDDVEWSTSNYNLFHEILRYDFGTRLFFKNVLSNMLMFIPYGFFVAYYLESKSLKPIIVLALITSLTIEGTQLLIGRVFDVDDIILNMVGAILGYIVYRLFIFLKVLLPSFLRKDWFYNLLSLGLVTLIILYILNIFNFGGFPW